jgi:glycosyltransferase involved in cell wall biosynthesis
MKVALIHDHLAQDGGAEKVLKVFAEMYIDAPIFTLLYDQTNADKYFKNRVIDTSIIQRLPGGVKHYKWYMPFMSMAVEFFDLRNFDLVLSDASAFAKGVITSSNTLHICYCHTPTRYLWSDTHQYIQELNYNKYFKKVIALMLRKIRIWDRVAADRVDVFIANSKFVAKRIKKYYRRDSTVIYPPVDVNKFTVSDQTGDYFLIGGRLAPYKRVDIVIEAFKGLDKKLKIFGDGVDYDRLVGLAKGAKNIEFVGRVSETEQAKLYSEAVAFINPQEEDFGITVIESMASGRPVIAYGSGGALETVAEGATGSFFYEQTAEAVKAAIINFDSAKFDSQAIRRHAEQFSVERFKREIAAFIEIEYQKFKQN